MRASFLYQLDPLTVNCLASGTTDFSEVSYFSVFAFLGFRAAIFKTDANTTVEPIISIGFNNPDYNNLASSVTIASTVPQFVEFAPWPISSPTTIKCNVNSPATADSFSISIYPFFLYVPV